MTKYVSFTWETFTLIFKNVTFGTEDIQNSLKIWLWLVSGWQTCNLTGVGLCVWIWASLYFWLFKRHCTTHISVVSGSHVGTIILHVSWLLTRILTGRTVASVHTLLVCWITVSLHSEILLLYYRSSVSV